MISANCASCKRGHGSSKNAPKSDAVAVFGLIDRIFFAVSFIFRPARLSFDAGRRPPTADGTNFETVYADCGTGGIRPRFPARGRHFYPVATSARPAPPAIRLQTWPSTNPYPLAAENIPPSRGNTRSCEPTHQAWPSPYTPSSPRPNVL